MRFLNYIFLFLIVGALLQNCAPKASKSKATEVYSEDISGLRPSLDEQQKTENQSETESTIIPEKGPYVPPTNDITDELNVALAKVNEVQDKKPYTVYTVQVYNGRSREQANEVRRQVYSIMSDVKPQLEYRQPNWKVKVGAFQNRADAYKTFKKLKESFPATILVPERITP